MGSVYKAEHEMMHKTVAIKVLHGDFAENESYRRRFSREAQAAAKLDHQNICEVLDFDTTAEGVSYLVMEYLDGELLTQRLEKMGRLSPLASIRIMRQLFSALECAHENGVIHRDVKPDNIFLIHRDGADDFVKLIDFGIARINGGTSDHKTMTRAGQILGTPQYLAPEQAMGDNVDHRADLYACGCIFYELLMGVTPFTGSSYIELMNKHVSEDAPHLDRTIAQSERLDEIIQRLLNKAPEVRFQSASEVLPLLDEIQLLLSSDIQAPALASGVSPVVSSGVSPVVSSGVSPVVSYADAMGVAPQAYSNQPDAAPVLDVQSGGYRSVDLDSFEAGPSRWRKMIIALVVAIVFLIVVIAVSLSDKATSDEPQDAPAAANEPETVNSGDDAPSAEPSGPVEVNTETIAPEPYNYKEDGFKISFDAVLSFEISILNAVENYYSMNYEEAGEALLAVRDKYWNHPNYLRLYVMMEDQLGQTDKVYEGLEHLMEIEPEAVRNPSVAQILLKYAEEPEAYERIDALLSEANPPYAAYFVAWLIIQSPYDIYEARLDHLTDLYNLLNPAKVPAWLKDVVRLWEFPKEDCETRLRLIGEIAEKRYPEAKEYVFVPWDGYRSRECKNRHRPADCNACLRPWFDAHRPAGVEPVVETFDEAEDNPAAAKPVKAVPKPNDKTVTRPRKMKDSAPVVTDDKVLPI